MLSRRRRKKWRMRRWGNEIGIWLRFIDESPFGREKCKVQARATGPRRASSKFLNGFKT